MENEKVRIEFDKASGEPKTIEYKKTSKTKNKKFEIKQNFFEYVGNPQFDNHYAFYFTTPSQKISPENSFVFTAGDCCFRLFRVISKNIFVVYSLFRDSDSLSVDTVVGDVPSGINYLVKYIFPQIKNHNSFWTDDNGLQFVERNFDKSLEYYARFAPMVNFNSF